MLFIKSSFISSSIAGSSIVAGILYSSLSAIFLTVPLNILPDLVFGSLLTTMANLKAATGIGVQWLSPFGPVKVYLSKAILKETYDKTETFRFTFGTTY